jgi:hypothetical protein
MPRSNFPAAPEGTFCDGGTRDLVAGPGGEGLIVLAVLVASAGVCKPGDVAETGGEVEDAGGVIVLTVPGLTGATPAEGCPGV